MVSVTVFELSVQEKDTRTLSLSLQNSANRETNSQFCM